MRARPLAAVGLAVLMLSAGGLYGLAGAVSVAAGSGPPWAIGDEASVALGQGLHLRGGGWDWRNGTLEIQLCGNLALDGSNDCDVTNTDEPAVRSDGTFDTAVTVSAPPVLCPCVVRIGYRLAPDMVKIPIDIRGVGIRDPQAPAPLRRAVTVTGVRLTGGGPWTSWFGGAPWRTLTYSVSNTGDVALHHPATDIAIGKGSPPQGFVEAPDIGDLAVHQTKTMRVRVSFGALAVGSYGAVVRVDPVGEVGSGGAHGRFIPWGLVVVAVLVLQLGVIVIRKRIRARLAGRRRQLESAPASVVAGVRLADTRPADRRPAVALHALLDDVAGLFGLEAARPSNEGAPANGGAATNGHAGAPELPTPTPEVLHRLLEDLGALLASGPERVDI